MLAFQPLATLGKDCGPDRERTLLFSLPSANLSRRRDPLLSLSCRKRAPSPWLRARGCLCPGEAAAGRSAPLRGAEPCRAAGHRFGLGFLHGLGRFVRDRAGGEGTPRLGVGTRGGSGRALVGRGPQWRGHDGEQGLIVDGPLGPRSGALTEKCWILMPGAFAFGGY